MNQPIAPQNLFDTLPEEPYNPPIGELLGGRRLSPEDVTRIRERQEQLQIRFGAAAVELGLVTQDDVRLALATQYRFPALHNDVAGLAPELVCAVDPTNAVAEAIRRLRTELMLRWRHGEGSRCVAIVGAERGEGRSFIAANLAIAFAQLNVRTMLLDADLRHGRLDRLFRLKERSGLSGLLIGRVGLQQVIPIASHHTLSVMGAGPLPPNPQELLSTDRFRQVVQTLNGLYDVVIVDTSSWDLGSDAQVVCAATRSAVLVSNPRKAVRREKMVELTRAVQSTEARMLGALVNRH